jgi:hypothetical protein
METDRGFKYKIWPRPDGRYDFQLWPIYANSRRDKPLWHHTVKTRADGERLVKKWIDDRQPRSRKRSLPKGRR